jgi:hypothetical protein
MLIKPINMFDNKNASNKETHQVEAPTNAFDVMIEVFKHRQEFVMKTFMLQGSEAKDNALKQVESFDVHIQDLKLISVDNYDTEEEA